MPESRILEKDMPKPRILEKGPTEASRTVKLRSSRSSLRAWAPGLLPPRGLSPQGEDHSRQEEMEVSRQCHQALPVLPSPFNNLLRHWFPWARQLRGAEVPHSVSQAPGEKPKAKHMEARGRFPPAYESLASPEHFLLNPRVCHLSPSQPCPWGSVAL